MRKIVIFSLFFAIAAAASPVAAQDIAKGKRAFEACATCHTGDPDGPGPDLTGVIGRRAGSVAGFRYSTAMKQSGIIWTAATLKAFLQHPQAVVRGNRMPFAGVADPAEADAISAYLATMK
jgi:cytochrome c